jgi:hypothetical protein
MKFEKEIREQRRIAQEFAEDRKYLLAQVPFGSELEQTRFDLERIASPTVAVAGAYSVGKSALINALCGAEILPVGVTPTTLVPIMLGGGAVEFCLVNTAEGSRKETLTAEGLRNLVTHKESPARYVIVESPRVAHIPWTWLDAPGVNADLQKAADLDLKPQDVADVCLLATSSLQPLSLSDLGQLVQLAEIFPGERLCLVLTRWDQLGLEERETVLRYVREMLASALPQRQIKIFSVSRKDTSALAQIREHLSATVYHHQKAQLEEALDHWKETLADLGALLEMRELAQVKPETLQQLQKKLDDVIIESGAQLKLELPRFMAELHRQAVNDLPSPHRQLEESFQEKFQEQFAPRLHAIGQRINEELMAELRKDLTKKQTSVSLANRFLGLLEPSNPFFDWMSATQVGGVATVGAALLAAGAATPVGWAIAGAAVIGGLLGGLIGSASTIDSADELQEKVVAPLTQKYQQLLSSAIASYRRDLAHLSKLMQKVVAIFSQEEASSYKDDQIKRMQMFIRLADETKRKNLASRFRKIEADRQAAEFAEQMQREAAAQQALAQGTVAASPKPAGTSSSTSKGAVAALPKTTGSRSSKKH